jgi:hypothetical protein
MKIQFLQKFENVDDLTNLLYAIDDKKVKLEVGRTAMSVYNVYDLSDDELGMIFIPAITDIYVRLKKQGADLEKISIDSEGAKIKGKIVYSKAELEDVLKRKSRRLINGEYWEIKKVESEDGKPYKIYNTHQKEFEEGGSYIPDFIDCFSTMDEAIDFLYKQ